jgi:hypothetical protein
VYQRKKQVALNGTAHTKEYIFGAHIQGWPFCQVCAVHVFANAYGPSEELMKTWTEEKRKKVSEQWDVVPLNARAFDNLDKSSFKVKQSDEGTDGYVLD